MPTQIRRTNDPLDKMNKENLKAEERVTVADLAKRHAKEKGMRVAVKVKKIKKERK